MEEVVECPSTIPLLEPAYLRSLDVSRSSSIGIERYKNSVLVVCICGGDA